MELRKKIVDLAKMISGPAGLVFKFDENAPEYYALECVVSDEMAEVALSMGLRKNHSAAEIARLCGKPLELTTKLLYEMAQIGLCTFKQQNGVDVFHVPIFAPGVGVPEMLSAVLQLIPLDYAMKQSLIGMLAPPEQGPQPIHDRFGQVLKDSGYAGDELLMLPKPEFYERARKAFCVLVTGEQARFANIIVRKGVIK